MTIGSYEKFTDLHTARSQRDANIDWMEWQSRLKPLRPWGRMVVESLAFGALILAAIYIGPILLGVAIDWMIGR